MLFSAAVALASCTRTQVLIAPEARAVPVRRIAVMDFAYSYADRPSPKLMNILLAGSYVNPGAGRLIAERLGAELMSTGRYRLVERSQIDKLLGEHKFEKTDFASVDGVRRLGKLLGVDAIVVGTVDLFQITWVLCYVRSDVGFSARMLDVETGEVLWAARGRRSFFYGAPEDAADGLVGKLASELHAALSGGGMPVSAPPVPAPQPSP